MQNDLSPRIESIRNRIDDAFAYPHLFIEHFLWIKTKKGQIVPFYLNDIQRKYYEMLMKQYWKPYRDQDGGTRFRLQGVREVNLKARQFGLSTFISALLFYDTIAYSGTDTRIYCQDKKYSKEMLEKYKFFYENLPEDCKPVKKNFSQEKISFSRLNSSLYCGTPGVALQVARKQGRSTTFRNLHASEFAEWSRPKVALNAMMDAIPSGDGIVLLESSPNMMNDDFHVMYNQGKSRNSIWKSRFWPWFEHSEYQRTVSPKECQWILSTLSNRERWLIKKFSLTLEQLAWRRDKISEKSGDIQLYTKEYPENDFDCFAAESELVFPSVLHRTRCVQRPAIPGHVHTIGVDVSMGLDGGDKAAIVVIDADTGEQCYAWTDMMDPVDLAHEVYGVWRQYPGLVGIEINNQGLATYREARTNPKLRKWRRPEPGFLYSNNRKGGYETTGANKGPSLFRLRAALRQGLNEVKNGGRLGIKLSSQEIVDQMGYFQFLNKDDKKHGFGAPENSYDEHGEKLCDDLITGLLIAYNLLEELWVLEDVWSEKFGDARYFSKMQSSRDEDEMIMLRGDIEGDDEY